MAQFGSAGPGALPPSRSNLSSFMPSTVGPSLKATIEDFRSHGADTRPALLALLVDRVIEEGPGDADSARRLGILLPRLMEGVAPALAREAAERLAGRADLPAELVHRLASGPIDSAAPLLRLSPALDEAALLQLAAGAEPARLQAIAARRDVSPELAKRLASTVHHAREAHQRRPQATADFFTATPEERATLLHRLLTLPPLPLAERVGAQGGAFTDSLLAAAKREDRAALALLLERALAVPAEAAARIVEDEAGQALAIAARALGLSFAVLSRILFRLHPGVGRSSSDMARLADLFDGLPLASAQHMVAIWRGARRAGVPRPAADTPSMRDFAVPRPAPGSAQAGDTLAEPRRQG
ncbi:uncharacterized protein (DUF2336 family) [Ancylobacter sp. 3268]|uniref:hypothetical protein n=1 Tax=Ancylobacter sp. 3268 TaxID=2817752 RepID=UPI0028665E19|nr:hypothetical protein [Ancylobacter sp. 3268]MDR6952737.1 uncharacterized protein (DUF2336 family) [Ancylobacter sp. 3268]